MPLNQSKMLIRVDAGIGVGAKRVNAMLALAREYRRRGGHTVMVVNEIPNSLLRRIESEGTCVHQIRCVSGSDEDQFETCEIIDLEKPDWLAVSGKAFNSKFVRDISASVDFLLLADGIERSVQANLIVGGQPPVDEFHADDSTGSFTPRLAGPAFALVDRVKVFQPSERKIVAQARRILVWNHGPDVDNWTLRTLQSLSDMTPKRLVVDCVASPDYLHFAELENFKRHARVTLRIHRNVDRIEPLAERTDLAVANGHAGCYRLAYLGVPSILISTPESNLSIIEALHRHRAAVSVAHTTDSGTNRSADLVNAVKKLLTDRFRRHSMSRHGMELIDGEGPKRVANRIANCMVSLRTATPDDCELFWHWRNDPESRSVSLSKSPTAKSDHSSHFHQTLNSNDHATWIAENRSKSPIGKIDIQFQDSGSQAILNMTLDQNYRGRGNGVVIIEAAVRKLFDEFHIKKIIAQVRTGNVAIEKSYRDAGFISITPKIINGALASQFLRAVQPELQQNPTQRLKAA